MPTPEEIASAYVRELEESMADAALEPAVPDVASKESKEPKKLEEMHPEAIPLGRHLASLAEAPAKRMLIWEADAGSPALLTPGTYVGAQFNPTEIEAGVDVDWNRFKSPGGHYAHMQFSATNNYTMEFELYFSAYTREELIIITENRNVLHKWCQPVYDNGWSIGPPRLYMEWAGSFRLQCYLVECRFKHLKFALNGETTRFSAKLKLEEAADTYQFTGTRTNIVASEVRGLIGYQAPTSTGKRALRGRGPLSKVSKSFRSSAATQQRDQRKTGRH